MVVTLQVPSFHYDIEMTAQSKLVKHTQGYVINREPFKQILAEKVAAFNDCERIILKEIRAHDPDFTAIRIDYLLAKLRTYIGLARLSETQWQDWFGQEVRILFEDLKKWVLLAERG